MKFITKEEGIQLPKRSTKHSAGYDFFAPENITIHPGESATFDTKVACELDDDKVLMLYVRSSYGIKYGVTLANNTGIIDSDYFPNNIMCKLVNNGDKDLVISKGDKFMQGVIIKYYTTEDDNADGIRDGGIGSTGK